MLLNHLVEVRELFSSNQNQEKLLSKECGGARESDPIIVGILVCNTKMATSEGDQVLHIKVRWD